MKKIYFILMGLLFVLSVSFYYCNTVKVEEEETETVIDDPSFASDIQPIFTNNCAVAGCHNAAAQAGLVLLSGVAYGNLVNVNSTQEPTKKRVNPSDPAGSYLVIKIDGNQTQGGRMPAGGSALSSAKRQNIRNWIAKGAKNN